MIIIGLNNKTAGYDLPTRLIEKHPFMKGLQRSKIFR
jgi:hypothetical protein